MSFVDLATLTLHRRNELETRINSFLEKSDHAIKEIKKLEVQAQGFVQQLNCEPSELKERFLTCMKQLDEYMYLITDFNLALGKLEETYCVDLTPVLDTTSKSIQLPSSTPFNIIDVLSESTPITSTACSNQCPPQKQKMPKVPKEEQVLIEFSSTSCSSESVPSKSEHKQTQCQMGNEIKESSQSQLAADMDNLAINEGASTSASNESYNLPAQSVLQTEHMYPATVMSVDGASFWVITDDPELVYTMMIEMTDFYKANHVTLTVQEVTSLHYCAFYDEESDAYYRGFFIKLIEDLAEVFLVDTGEMRTSPISCVQPLDPRFCDNPPYARCCHLAGIDIDTVCNDSVDVMTKLELFMKQYIGVQCHIEVDDNSSESIGVYVILPTSKESLNELMVQQGLAIAIDKTDVSGDNQQTHRPPECVDSENDILDCPEYEDPVEAVTGYHNRDEEDICKHYKGGPEKTCFKGARCKKKHVVKHPDGWTLDKVEAFVCKPHPLPAPDTWHKVVVTYVCHYNRAYVQFVRDEREDVTVPKFGVVLPPTALTALVRDMNSPASRMAYKPLTTIPALGEMVAALYPMDGQWYRARVVTVCRADQNVEVMYVDYGNIVWVKENDIRALEPRWAALPAQALRARLAGVGMRTTDSKLWARAKNALHDLLFQRTLHMHVVGRDYDEITVELFDDDVNIAEELAKIDMVELEDYAIEDDSKVTHKLVLP